VKSATNLLIAALAAACWVLVDMAFPVLGTALAGGAISWMTVDILQTFWP
jgi:hypothetical protein